jgi:hypothetical protein
MPAALPRLRDSGLVVLLLALAVLTATLFSHGFRITSDGVDHYVYLRSLFVDHDLDLANDYALVSPRGDSATEATPLGRTGNAHPIGPAVVWAPFYLVADAVSRATGRSTDGLSPLYQDAVCFGSLLYGWLGLVLLYRTATREAGRAPALIATLGIGFGTFLYWYLAFAPTMAQAPAFAAAALFVYLWLRPLPHGRFHAAALGAACGLAALMKWSSALLVLLPAVEALPRLLSPRQWRRLIEEAVAFGLAAALVFSPQMVVWKLLYGSALTIPQGSAFVSGAPAWGGVLFSPRHGLFSWSPILYLGALGLFAWLWRGGGPWRVVASVAFGLALTRANAGVADWWGGSAFGARRFDALLPLLGIGLALAIASLAQAARSRPLLPAAVLVVALIAWNLLVAQQYRSGAWDYAGPVAFEEMGRGAVSLVDRAVGSPFALPASLWTWLRGGPAPADYESLFMERRYARWAIRMGEDDRMFLEDGWSAPREDAGVSFRQIARGGAGLVVPLHEARAYQLGARLRPLGAMPPQRVRVLVNERFVGAWDLGAEWEDYELEVPADALRMGRNAVRLRRPGDGPWEGTIAVAGAWLEPQATTGAATR